MRVSLASLAAGSLVFLSGVPALAQGPVAMSGTPDVARFRMTDDLYIAGGNVSVTEEITGDLVAAGGNVMVSGPVRRDVIAGGGQVTLRGDVGDDVRVGGGTVRIEGRVNGDVVVTGGNVIIDPTASIGGDLAAFGGMVEIRGRVNGKVTTAGGEVIAGGSIGGAAELKGENVTLAGTIGGPATVVAERITLANGASLQRGIRYWQDAGEMDFSKAIVAGTGAAVFDEDLAIVRKGADAEVAAIGILGAWSMLSFLSSAFALFLLMLVFPRVFRDAARQLQAYPWKSLLAGFLYYAAFPIAFVLLCMTVVGVPVALVLMVGYVLTVIFSALISALVLARWLEIRMKATWHPGLVFAAALGILILLKFLWIIPFLGWVVRFVAVFFAVGALLLAVWNRRKHP